MSHISARVVGLLLGAVSAWGQVLTPALLAEIETKFVPLVLPVETPLPSGGPPLSEALWWELDGMLEFDYTAYDAIMAAGRVDLNAEVRVLFVAVRGLNGLGIGLYDYDYLITLNRNTGEIISRLEIGSIEDRPVYHPIFEAAGARREAHGTVAPDGSVTVRGARLSYHIEFNDESGGQVVVSDETELGEQRWFIGPRGAVSARL